MTRQAELNGCTQLEPVLCAFLKSKQTTYDTSRYFSPKMKELQQ